MTILGIDPGQSGAMVLINENGQIQIMVNMPDTPMDILETIEAMSPSVCYLEDVGHGLPGQSSSATAKFARHNGHLEMALLALKIPTVKILPNKWQKTLGLSSKKNKEGKKEEKRDHKNRIKAWAQLTFPTAKVTLHNADALGIAHYGYLQEKR